MKRITWLSVVARKPFIKLCSFYLYCQCPCSTSGPSPDYSSLVWARKFVAPSQGPQSFWSNQNSSIINTLSLPLTLILQTLGGWEGQKFWCLFTKGRSDSNDLSCRILAAKSTMFCRVLLRGCRFLLPPLQDFKYLHSASRVQPSMKWH